MDGMRGWLVGAGPPDSHLTRFPMSKIVMGYYYFKKAGTYVVGTTAVGTEGAGTRHTSLEVKCPIPVPTLDT
jgi:hypothetical protein